MSAISDAHSLIDFFDPIENAHRLPIEQLQTLEKTRKKLKEEFLKLDQGKDNYLSIKRKIGFLKEQHLAFRIAILAKKCWKKGEPLPHQLERHRHKFIPPSKTLSKEDRKLFWPQIENDLISLFSKEDPKLIAILEQICLLHGTQSTILPFLPHTEYSLFPTGSLIKFKKIAPMCGELGEGVGSHGVNDGFLSLETLRNLERSWRYAENTHDTFTPEKFKDVETLIRTSLDTLSKLSPINDSNKWTQVILSLMQLKQYQPDAFYRCIQNYAKQIASLKQSISKTYVKLEQLMLEALDTPLEELQEVIRSPQKATAFEKKWKKKDIYIPRGWHTLKGPYDFDSFLELVGTYSVLTRVDLLDHVGTAITHIMKMKLFGAEELFHLSYFPNTYYSCHVWNKLVSFPGLKEKLPSETWQKLDKKSKEPVTKFDLNPSFFTDFFVSKYRSIERMFNLSPFTKEEYELLVHHILEHYIRGTIENRLKTQLFPLKETLEDLDQLLKAPFIHFSESELKWITKPFPLLLASTSHKPQKVFSEADEFSSRKIPFGKGGIDLIFVKKENLEEMQEWLKKHKLEKEITVLDALPIVEASQKLPLYHASFQIDPKHDFFLARTLIRINYILDTDATSFYKKPYPDGSIRKIHGIPHATRTAFWAYILANQFYEHDIQIEVSNELLILFSFLHDSGREDDGPDKKIWEQTSAKNGEEVCKKNTQPKEEEILLLKDSVMGKDDKLSNEVTQTKKIIHAADALEILRTLKSLDEFHSDELWLSGTFSKKEIETLVKHAFAFISLTEDRQLKKWLENSSSPFAALFQILECASSYNPQMFSWLQHQAESGIHAFCSRKESQLSQTEIERIELLSKKMSHQEREVCEDLLTI